MNFCLPSRYEGISVDVPILFEDTIFSDTLPWPPVPSLQLQTFRLLLGFASRAAQEDWVRNRELECLPCPHCQAESWCDQVPLGDKEGVGYLTQLMGHGDKERK